MSAAEQTVDADTPQNKTDAAERQSETESDSQSDDQLATILGDLVTETNGQKVTVREMLKTLDTRSFGPVLLVPALLALSPIGAIPVLPTVCASIIILFAGQMLFDKPHPWLPKKILDLSITRKKLTNGVEVGKPWASWLQRTLLARRLTFLTENPFDRIVAGICILLAMAFIPLELLPGAVAVPSGAICLFAIGLTVRDGLVVLAGLALTLLATYLTVFFWPF